MDMNAVIAEAIQKHLPATVGAELQAFIKQGQDAIKALPGFERELIRLRNEKEAWSTLDKRTADLNAREAKLMGQEVDLAKRIAVAEAVELSRATRLNDMKELVSLVFQNVRLREMVTRSRQEPVVIPQAGGGAYTTTQEARDTETRDREG